MAVVLRLYYESVAAERDGARALRRFGLRRHALWLSRLWLRGGEPLADLRQRGTRRGLSGADQFRRADKIVIAKFADRRLYHHIGGRTPRPGRFILHDRKALADDVKDV